jgi:uncharacterized protein (DUF362 family)
MSSNKNFVVITRAKQMSYRQDYATLPANYGTLHYYSRSDIKSIMDTVHENLTLLNEKSRFTDQLKGKKVVIKPNLVCVFSNTGFKERDYPESTDPRVLDAIIHYLKNYTDDIVMVESSGRGMPTRGSFRISGLKRMAEYHKIELQALEEQPVDRYILPKAKIMKEIIVPKIFSEVAAGEAFYISVPKMKTNLYTGVTLGFKNAMGTITYNLRQRNHNYCLDQKLVDMLHLFKPHLTIIDGIIGGEGNCPAPVDPVDSHVIVSGTNSVETDRVATRLMGFEPREIALMRLADEGGFGDPETEIIGEEIITPYRPADPSLMGEWMAGKFPNVRVLIGHTKNNAPAVEGGTAGNELIRAMEMACRGGCLATTRYAFDMLYYEGKKRNFHLTLIIGAGVTVNGELCYLDRMGTPYSVAEIRKLPGKKLAVGSCSMQLIDVVDRHIAGCMPMPNSPHMAIHWLNHSICNVISLKNKHLLPLLYDTLRMSLARIKCLNEGQPLDCAQQFDDGIVIPPSLSAKDMQKEFILWPMAPLTGEDKRKLVRKELRSVLSTFLG